MLLQHFSYTKTLQNYFCTKAQSKHCSYIAAILMKSYTIHNGPEKPWFCNRESMLYQYVIVS